MLGLSGVIACDAPCRLSFGEAVSRACAVRDLGSRLRTHEHKEQGFTDRF